MRETTVSDEVRALREAAARLSLQPDDAEAVQFGASVLGPRPERA